MLQSGSDWLLDQLKQHTSLPVTYRRGNASAEVPAVIGRTTFEIADEFGVLRKFESRDFLIQAADLVLGGQPVEPRTGDRIEETHGAVAHVYEVLSPGNEPVYRFSDPYRKTYRIHSKQVDQT